MNSRLVSRCANLSPIPDPTVSIDVEAVFGKFNAMPSEYLVELRGLEPATERVATCGNPEMGMYAK